MRKLLLVFVLGLFGQCVFSRPDDIPVIIHRDWNNRVELVSSCVKDTVRVWVGVTLRFNAEFLNKHDRSNSAALRSPLWLLMSKIVRERCGILSMTAMTCRQTLCVVFGMCVPEKLLGGCGISRTMT